MDRAYINEIKIQIVQCHEQFERHVASSVDQAIRAGELLAEIRDEMTGSWKRWATDELPFSYKTATHYIRVYEASKCCGEDISPDKIRLILAEWQNDKVQKGITGDDAIAETLRKNGGNRAKATGEHGAGRQRVDRIWERVVRTEFLEVDWMKLVNESPDIVSIAAAKLCGEIREQAYEECGMNGTTWSGYAAPKLGVGMTKLTNAAYILEHGIPHLISAVGSGAIKESVAHRLAHLPHAEQESKLVGMDMQDTGNLPAVIEDIKLVFDHMLDHKASFQRAHPNGCLDVNCVDVSDLLEDREIHGLVNLGNKLVEWCASITEALRERLDICSVKTAEQKTT